VIRGGKLAQLRIRAALRPRRDVSTVRLGSDYGGWHVPPELLTPDSVVYSAGVGEDVSFDLALIGRVGCQVWAFDPTPRAIEFAARLDEPSFHFRPYALWSSDTTLPFYVPADERHVSHSLVNLGRTEQSIEVRCRSVQSLMRELGHDRVDLLKLDIEGAEYEVLGSLGDGRPRIVCVELHRTVSVSTLISFTRSLPYDPVRVDRWNVTMLARESADRS
jgi:FkbM family methyltransferase